MKRDEIETIVREDVQKSIGKYLQSSPNSDQEELTEGFVSDGRNIQINENVIMNLAAKGMDKYQFKFLELGDDRYIFTKGQDGTFKWFHFGGNTFIDKGDAESAKALDDFIQDKISTGYKVVNKDGAITRFFKAIGRGVAVILKIVGGMQILGAVLLTIFILFAGAAFVTSLGTTMPIMAGSIAAQGLFGVAVTGTGWVIGKVSRKQDFPLKSA